MLEAVFHALVHALTIAAFVAVMMLWVEYAHVRSSGAWSLRLTRNRWGQYLLAAALGAVPGCLGAFVAVALYSHRMLSLGAIVAAMIATSGDEAFVMLAMMPGRGAVLIAGLFVLAMAVGFATDVVVGKRAPRRPTPCDGFELHEEEADLRFSWDATLSQWRRCSWPRAALSLAAALLLVGAAAGFIGGHAGPMFRATLTVAFGAALAIIVTASDHFLDEHVWRHIVRQHVPRMFLWTLGALLAAHVIEERLALEEIGQAGRWAMLIAAGLVGLIPESGPHLMFVTLCARGVAPWSVLLTSAIVQDGHGMLPLLAHSRREFLLIKAVKLGVGLTLGAAAMGLGL